MVPDLPSRGLARGVRLAALPATFVGRRAVAFGRRLGGAPAEALTAELQQRTAEQLFAVLGELKGGALKVGQWLSAMEAALPEQVAGPYGEALTRLQEAAPPMPRSVVEGVVRDAFGAGWRRQLVSFDPDPVAAASIGQVHRATWPDGRPVAVKVQYPGVARALATDLRQLDRLLPVVRAAAPGMDARTLFAELRAGVMAEVDYRQEAAAQTAFARAFAADRDFAVPEVLAVTGTVLVSEWVDGTPVAKLARRSEQATRDRTGVLLARFLLSSPGRVGRLHGDPHPGNFRLLDDGRLAVLDFGSTLPMDGGWSPRLAALLRAGRDRDASGLTDMAVTAGLISPGAIEADALLELVDPLLEPLRSESFTFNRPWLRSQTARFSDPRSASSRVQRKLRIPVRYLLVQRVTAGTTGVLCSLGATVPIRAEAASWLPGFAPGG